MYDYDRLAANINAVTGQRKQAAITSLQTRMVVTAINRGDEKKLKEILDGMTPAQIQAVRDQIDRM